MKKSILFIITILLLVACVQESLIINMIIVTILAGIVLAGYFLNQIGLRVINANNFKILQVACVLLLFLPSITFAAEKFIGGGGDDLFTNPANWDGGLLPNPGDDLEIKADCIFDQLGSIAYNKLRIKDGATLSWLNGSFTLNIKHLENEPSGGILDMSNAGILIIREEWKASIDNLVFIPGSGTVVFQGTGNNSQIPTEFLSDIAYGWGDHSIAGYLTSFTELDPIFGASSASGIIGTDLTNWNTAYGWGDHSIAGYLTSFTELDPIFGASSASGISGTDIVNWNTAFGWGNHAGAGYLTSFTELDPIFGASSASGISGSDITNWNTAYGWGDHTGAGYLTSFTELDPIFGASSASGILASDITNWNTAYGWGDHAGAGYLTSFTELDPVFGASSASGILGSDITNWNTAHGWGDHSGAGYLTSSGTVQGTGANSSNIRATVEGAVAGNARGESSVDLQTARATSTQVASGNQSSIGGGRNNTASGHHSSVGGGFNNTALANNSTASGRFTTASGYTSTAMGNETTSSGYASTTMGHRTIADGNYSTAMGQSTIASGETSTAMGNETTASGDFSTASGLLTTASGYNSTTMGQSTIASGDHSKASGRFTTASGYASAASGNNTIASGTGSTTSGNYTIASGTSSTASGQYTTASGELSTASGESTIASGDASTAMGNGTTASGYASTAMGVGITAAFVGELHNSGDIRSAGTILTSDIRYKKDVKDLSNALDKVLQLQGVTYEYKTDEHNRFEAEKGKTQIGFIAQEVQKILPELVSSDGTEDAYLGIRYANMSAVLVEAVKEQQNELDNKDERIAELEDKVDWLIAQVSSLTDTENGNADSTMDVTLSGSQLPWIEQNVPNPFMGQTKINYFVPESNQEAAIQFFDMQGKLIKTTLITEKGKGSINLKADNLATGIYSYQLVVDGRSIDTKKMQFLK